MKNFSIKFCLLMALAFFQKLEIAAAAPPNWSVNPAHFQFSMNFIGRLQTNGVPNNASQNLLGIFVGNELRGVASPIVLGGVGYFFATIYANSYAGETLHFRVYLAADDKIYSSSEVASFIHNGCSGKFEQPFVIKICRDYAIALTSIPPTCFGSANGTIFTTVNGFSANYNYAWSNGKNTRDINLLPAGTYTLTVTDAAGCTSTRSSILSQPPEINFSVNFAANPPNYNAIFSTSGGTPGYTYNRTGMATSDFRVASDPIFKNLAPNTSFVFKVKDANGCQKSVIKKTPTIATELGNVGSSQRTISNSFAPKFDLLIFPNPANDLLNCRFFSENLEIPNDFEQNFQPPRIATISIFDPLGRLVFFKNEADIPPFSEDFSFQFQLPNLPTGHFFLKIQNANGDIWVQRVAIVQ